MRIGLPVEPNDDLPGLLNLRANSWVLTHPEWEYRDGCIFLEIRGMDPALDPEYQSA